MSRAQIVQNKKEPVINEYMPKKKTSVALAEDSLNMMMGSCDDLDVANFVREASDVEKEATAMGLTHPTNPVLV